MSVDNTLLIFNSWAGVYL